MGISFEIRMQVLYIRLKVFRTEHHPKTCEQMKNEKDAEHYH